MTARKIEVHTAEAVVFQPGFVEFVNALQMLNKYKLTHAYSRNLEPEDSFAYSS
jgi:hypothetical protein